MASLVHYSLRRASQAASGNEGLEAFASACRELLVPPMGIRSSSGTNEKLQMLGLILPSNEDAPESDFAMCAALLRTELPTTILEQYLTAVDESHGTYEGQANMLPNQTSLCVRLCFALNFPPRSSSNTSRRSTRVTGPTKARQICSRIRLRYVCGFASH